MKKGDLQNPAGVNLSERNFRRFEEVIAKLVETFPNAYVITPTNLAPSTFASRIRDAINGVLHHRYATSVDLNRLLGVWQQVVVTIKGTTVVIAKRESLRETIANLSLVTTADAVDETLYAFTLTDPPTEVLSALSVLYRHEILTRPTKLICAQAPACVETFPQPDGTYLLL